MPFNQLTDAQAERLVLLAEECGEVIQAVGKILRHGYESRHPFIEDDGTNRQALEKELGDVLACIDMLIDAYDLKGKQIRACAVRKLESVKQWLHHQYNDDHSNATAYCRDCCTNRHYHGDPDSIHLHLCDVCNGVVDA